MADRSGLLGTPLAQFGLGALALVVGGALLFTLIGAVSDPDGAGDGSQPVATSTPADDASTPSATASEADGTPTTAPTDPTTAPTAEPTASDPATTEPPAIDPSGVTIQVLDGSDDGADQDTVVACLEAAGYSSLITSNQARTTYSTTTVFYTAGEDSQAAAEQVAQALGLTAVEEQPGNLSDSVPVHVVTGQDGSELC